jgi:hypothetical protein
MNIINQVRSFFLLSFAVSKTTDGKSFFINAKKGFKTIKKQIHFVSEDSLKAEIKKIDQELSWI